MKKVAHMVTKHCQQMTMNENDVVAAVCEALKKQKWRIDGRCDTNQAGIDIIASRGTSRLHVEAKGNTSSKEASRRFGKPMTGTQLFIQIAAALLKASEMRCKDASDLVAIALPDEPRMRQRVSRIEPALAQLRIGIFWVADSLEVTAWNM